MNGAENVRACERQGNVSVKGRDRLGRGGGGGGVMRLIGVMS